MFCMSSLLLYRNKTNKEKQKNHIILEIDPPFSDCFWLLLSFLKKSYIFAPCNFYSNWIIFMK